MNTYLLLMLAPAQLQENERCCTKYVLLSRFGTVINRQTAKHARSPAWRVTTNMSEMLFIRQELQARPWCEILR